ncbi:protein SOB FIVE-LIKE 1-like [Andrographis paniculata]|uniref:protein SOB FIVE-LIKE 1-like n=1 Tax=Andrographis paniculata TaxID=175694 RepID=UPI0021E81416|nr:protein SOB FIVE-LIKE 1-like [Andrographis paniculata]
MDSSKSLEECSSSESGWTRYIASSPEHNDDDDDDEADEDDRTTGHHQEGHKKDAEDVESDDSMASDASSGPSNQYGSRGLVHAGMKDERKHVGKKHSQQEEKKKQHKQIKADKDKHGNRANSAGRSKKG